MSPCDTLAILQQPFAKLSLCFGPWKRGQSSVKQSNAVDRHFRVSFLISMHTRWRGTHVVSRSIISNSPDRMSPIKGLTNRGYCVTSGTAMLPIRHPGNVSRRVSGLSVSATSLVGCSDLVRNVHHPSLSLGLSD